MLKVGFDLSPLSGPSRFRGIGKYTTELLKALRASRKVRVVEIKNTLIEPEYDLLHYPFFDFFFLSLPLFKKKKTIVTVHDCTPLVFPKQYPPGIKGRLKILIQKASLKGVVACSLVIGAR